MWLYTDDPQTKISYISYILIIIHSQAYQLFELCEHVWTSLKLNFKKKRLYYNLGQNPKNLNNFCILLFTSFLSHSI